MQPKRKKSVIVLIIILLLIAAPLAIIGTYFKFSGYKKPVKPTVDKNKETITETTSQDPNYKDGKLYFYNKDKGLIGEYTCVKNPCSYAISEIDDKNYGIDYYETEEQYINVLLNRYAFISDDDKILLYDITNNEVLSHYEAVKNYHNMISEDLMIVKNDDGKWGIIRLGDTISSISEFTYDFIGLSDKIGLDSLIDTSNYIIKNGNLWGIIDKEGDLISNYLANEITSYNDLLISIKNEDTYYLYDYYGKRVVDEKGFNYLSFTDKYINIVDKNDNLYVYDYILDKKLSPNLKVQGPNYKKSFTSILNNETNMIDITIDDKVSSYNID